MADFIKRMVRIIWLICEHADSIDPLTNKQEQYK